MATAQLRFHRELNDFLAPERRQCAFYHPFVEGVAVKALIEAVGVPHPEIALILINGESVGFSQPVWDGDRIDVFPDLVRLAIPNLQRLRPLGLLEWRFIVDVNLGKLARYLRLLGFDTLYRNDYDDPELAALAAAQQRVLLTRDLGLLKRRCVLQGYFIRATRPPQQLGEIVERLGLHQAIRPFIRCGRCNGVVDAVDKAAIVAQLQPGTQRDYDDFWQCLSCGQVYWRGSHYQQMMTLIDRLRRKGR